MASTRKLGAFFMYTLHAMLLNVGVELTQTLIHNVHALVGFVSVENEEDYIKVREYTR